MHSLGHQELVKVLCGINFKIYNSNNGEIFIDDKNLKLLNTKDIRKNIALVQQQPFLFSGKIIDVTKWVGILLKRNYRSSKKSKCSPFYSKAS